MTADLGRIRLVVTDVDGVLTAGVVALDGDGRRMGFFAARDGMAVTLARAAGLEVAIVSGAASAALRTRARELGIEHLLEGVRDKGEAVQALLAATGVRREEALMVGDDLNDLPAFRAVGVGVAVADAAPEVRAAADWITDKRGGEGALREVVESVLRARGAWDRTLAALFGPSSPAGGR